MSVIKKLLFLCFLLSFSLLSGQKESDLSQLSFQSLTDTINKYILNDLSKTVEASNVYILKAQRKNDKKEEYLGIEALAVSYISHRKYKKSQEYLEKTLIFAKENKLEE